MFPVEEGALCQITRKTEELLLVLQPCCDKTPQFSGDGHFSVCQKKMHLKTRLQLQQNCAVFMTRSHEPAAPRKAVPEALAGTLKMTYLGRPRPMMAVPML